MTVVLSALAVYYLTYCITQLDGPANVFLKLRDKWLSGVFRDAVSCFWCTSWWVSLLVCSIVSQSLIEWLLNSAAIAGAASLLYVLSNR